MDDNNDSTGGLTPGPQAPEIFIGGCERSGTTLLGRLVAEVAGLTPVPEAFFLHEALSKVGSDSRVTSGWRTLTWGLDSVVDPPLADGDQALADWFRRLCHAYHRRTAGGDQYRGFVENSPAALHTFPLLRAAFGDHIKMVTIIRDGRAVYSSWRRTDFGPATASAAADRWTTDALLSQRLADRYPDSVYCLRYEDVVSGGSSVVVEALGRIGVVPVACRSENGNSGAPPADIDSYTRRDHSLVNEPPDPKRTDSWRDELPVADQIAFTRKAYATLAAFDYPLGSDRPEVRPAPLERTVRQLTEPVLQLAKAARRAGRQAMRRANVRR